ncbi:hypothetical protein, partial [Enterocloster bolteae]|uniref:hypothetical protein n=1 Tax=Enterocloster bolteae TaxID=208479 RepID=UPI003AB2634C
QLLYLITVACVCQQLFSFFYFLFSCAFGTHRSARDILPDVSTNVNNNLQLFYTPLLHTFLHNTAHAFARAVSINFMVLSAAV